MSCLYCWAYLIGSIHLSSVYALLQFAVARSNGDERRHSIGVRRLHVGLIKKITCLSRVCLMFFPFFFFSFTYSHSNKYLRLRSYSRRFHCRWKNIEQYTIFAMIIVAAHNLPIGTIAKINLPHWSAWHLPKCLLFGFFFRMENRHGSTITLFFSPSFLHNNLNGDDKTNSVVDCDEYLLFACES